ncbi:MAG TPA: hypothetical protein VFM14_13455 [Gemmatimonadales bacterium]|nr:hypothetical protein [Gemmatimonadales bacterium]
MSREARSRVAALPIAFAFWWGIATPAGAQASAFSFDSSRVPVGHAFEYVKSNRDGTHRTQVTVYVAALDRVESLKWDSGADAATLVAATMDWERFCVRGFESRRLRRHAPEVMQGSLTTDTARRAIRVSFLPDSEIAVGVWPWHSYDFDFASLGAALPHLVDPQAGFVFQRMDVVYSGDEVGFADLGPVEVAYEQRERRDGRDSRRYRIGGPGLLRMAGLLWADARDGTLVEYELPVPDEPGFVDGRLRLTNTLQLGPADWEAYKKARIAH